MAEHARERARQQVEDQLVLIGDSDLLNEIAEQWLFAVGVPRDRKGTVSDLYPIIKRDWPELYILLDKAKQRQKFFPSE